MDTPFKGHNIKNLHIIKDRFNVPKYWISYYDNRDILNLQREDNLVIYRLYTSEEVGIFINPRAKPNSDK